MPDDLPGVENGIFVDDSPENVTLLADQTRLLVAPLCAACTARAWTLGEPLEPERKFFVA